MAKVSDPQTRITPPSPEEIRAKRRYYAENTLFATLGALCAVIVGFAIFGEFKAPPSKTRAPASEVEETTVTIHIDER